MFLECDNINFRYRNGSMDVFHDLSFQMKTPGFHALFGPSGVGKTSLARIIVGDITAYSGVVRSEGMQNLLYSYNLERLPDWSSVGKHLEKITPPSLRDRKNELIASFDMTQTMKLRFSQLSLGQQNRVNLIRYLLQDFHLLIMDESLANVDERTREKIILKIKDMFPDAYFLYISHNVIEVSKFCRDILVFRNSQKSPQVVTVKGRDHKLGQDLAREQLEQTMLEIMHAS
ncbi:MAG: ATP-binding cassette domain-containing protein [Desulfobacterales bacterium]|nr:ATP-binding cassette domain-containing protein [Desulfobacterales bacterium]MDX2513329.1 ATP-binding cassette domain-containing protein [Desulfobacterales bacterium]